MPADARWTVHARDIHPLEPWQGAEWHVLLDDKSVARCTSRQDAETIARTCNNFDHLLAATRDLLDCPCDEPWRTCEELVRRLTEEHARG